MISYDKFDSLEDFVKALYRVIDIQRAILIFAHNQKLPIISTKSISETLNLNLNLLLSACYTEDNVASESNPVIDSKRVTILSISKISDLEFLLGYVTEFEGSRAPFIIYFNGGNPCLLKLCQYWKNAEQTLKNIKKEFNLGEYSSFSGMDIQKIIDFPWQERNWENNKIRNDDF